MNRFLPKTGSEKRIILSLVGLISLSIASLILLANKYKRF
ncbi:LPXTG cell wall anchor domain-containing protein [Streptococcus bovimastitidis]